MTQILVIYFPVLNAVTFLLAVTDKGLSVYDKRRIPEKLLLALAFFGGAFGVKLAQVLLRHKRFNVTYSSSVMLFLLLQVGVGLAVYSQMDRAGDSSFYERYASQLSPGVERDDKPRRFGPGEN